MKIVYIGNHLKGQHRLPTGITFLGDALEREGLEVVRASQHERRVLRFFHMLHTIWCYRKKARFVLIDTYSTWNFWYTYFIGVGCRLLSLKYLPILHGGNLPQRLERCPYTSKQLFGHAYRNVATSGYLLKAFEKHGFKNTEHILNPLPDFEWPEKASKNLQPRLIWVRAFQAIYEPLTAIKVLEQLIKGYPKAELCMVGPDKDGSLSVCKNYARKHRLPVTFTGVLKQAEWMRLALDYDIFLHTSRVDNAPQSVLEAMSLGLCVVATRTGDIPNQLQNGKRGIVVGTGNVEEMVDGIHLLLQDQTLAQNMAGEARKFSGNFRWRSIRKQWLQLLDHNA